MKCSAVTKRVGTCSRKAAHIFEGRNGTRIGYCTQHRKGAGLMRLLLPFPWEGRWLS